MKIHIKDTDILHQYSRRGYSYQILVLIAILNDGWINNIHNADYSLNYVFTISNHRWIKSYIKYKSHSFYFYRYENSH